MIITNHEAQSFPAVLKFDRYALSSTLCLAQSALPTLFVAGSVSLIIWTSSALTILTALLTQSDSHPLSVSLPGRVLCDVPCSGDGTLRKLPDLWRRWNAGAAQPLHRLQVEIAWRGLQILSPGGRMVYSTCSFNPLENEAVVAEMLRRGDGRVELVGGTKCNSHLTHANGRSILS